MKKVPHQKTIEYMSSIPTVKVKKTLYALTIIDPYEMLGESNIDEIQKIGDMYEGNITGRYGKELALKIAKSYESKFPNVLLSEEDAKSYIDIRYKKLFEAVGLYGFDYVLTVLQNTKESIENKNSNVDEAQMLNAMRWSERRENHDVTESNKFHRRKGLEYAGFEEISEYLIPYAEIIAGVYELVKGEQAITNKLMVNSVIDMKIHFLKCNELIRKIYEADKPKCPEGYEEEDLTANSLIIKLAKKGFLTQSVEILEYVNKLDIFNNINILAKSEFSLEELEVISKNKDAILQLIANEW